MLLQKYYKHFSEVFTLKHAKIIALMLCTVLTLSLAGCGSAPSTVVTVDGSDVPAGVYLMYQLQAYNDAASKLTDYKADVLKSEIEGVKATEWIHTKTMTSLQRFTYIEKQFADAKLSFSEEELKTLEAQVESNFTSNEKLLAANGIGKESYRTSFMNEAKYQLLLGKYAEENEISDTDAKAFMDKTYVRAKMLTLPATTTDYQKLDDDKQAKLTEIADKLEKDLAADGDFDALAEAALKEAYTLTGREFTDTTLSGALTTSFVKEGSNYPEEFVTLLKAAKVGDAGQFDYYGNPLIYEKLANYADDTEFALYKAAIQSEMQQENFSAEVEEKSATLAVVENASAVKKYSAKKITEDVA